MGEVVDLKPVSLAENLEFIQDMARYRESILDEKSIRKKYRVDAEVWEKLGDDDALIRAIEAESIRRVRDGSCKREKAQKLVVKGPDILDSIASDVSASPRHRVDAIKTLDSMSSNGPESAPASDRFIISIVLNSDGDNQTLRFNKSIKPDPNDTDPFGYPDPMPPDMIAAMAKKKEDDGGGNNNL
jgi:hypothetical protein